MSVGASRTIPSHKASTGEEVLSGTSIRLSLALDVTWVKHDLTGVVPNTITKT